MKTIPTIFFAILVFIPVATIMFMTYGQATREQAIKNVATFGEQHKYEDFVLKKGTSLRIQTEIGDVLVCLPETGRPELLIDYTTATQAETQHALQYQQLAAIKVQNEQRRKEIVQAETLAESPHTMNLSPTTVAEIIRKQLELDVQEIAFKPQNTLDVVMGDKWETLPCTYQDGTFTVTRGNYEIKLKIKMQVIREGTL